MAASGVVEYWSAEAMEIPNHNELMFQCSGISFFFFPETRNLTPDT
jgi:hypothetical protein